MDGVSDSPLQHFLASPFLSYPPTTNIYVAPTPQGLNQNCVNHETAWPGLGRQKMPKNGYCFPSVGWTEIVKEINFVCFASSSSWHMVCGRYKITNQRSGVSPAMYSQGPRETGREKKRHSYACSSPSLPCPPPLPLSPLSFFRSGGRPQWDALIQCRTSFFCRPPP